jgi:hypothetical protein
MFRSLVRAVAPTLRTRFAQLFSATEGKPDMGVEPLEGRQLLSAVHPKGSRNGAVATPQSVPATYLSTRASRARARARAGAGSSLPSSNLAWDGPIVITQGGTYSGNWQSLDPNTPAVEIRTNQPVVIQNANVRSAGTLIDAYAGMAVNLTVRNVTGYGLNPNVKGVQGGRFLDVYGFVNIEVEHCDLENTCGIYLEKYVGNHTASQTFTIRYNVARNINGKLSDGNGGYLSTPGDHYVQFFQTNGLQNMVGAEVAWNQVTNVAGQSLVEDNISIFDTSGTRKSRILIHDNFIDGAYPINAATDTDFTGGGIMLSDDGGAFVSAYNNQIVDTTNYGMAISSGHDNAIFNNRIISSGELPDGTPVPTQNVGVYVWNQNGESGFTNNTGSGNVIGWTTKSGNNDSWTPDAASWTGNNEMDNTVTPATAQAEQAIWQAKLTKATVTVGVAS